MRTMYGGRMLAKARRKYGEPNYLEKGCKVKVVQEVPEEESDKIYQMLKEKFERKNEVWNSIKSVIKEEINPVSYETWIEPCELIFVSDQKILVQVENEIYKEMLLRRYLCYLQRAAEIVLSKNHIEIEVITECI